MLRAVLSLKVGRLVPTLLTGLLLASMGVSAATPLSSDNNPVLRIQGSNTIGAQLGPALVEGLMRKQGLQSVHTEPGAQPNEVRVSGTTTERHVVTIDVAAHGSSTGFEALKTGKADLAASSRAIKPQEALDLKALGDLRSHKAEQVIAIDGVAVILHPGNPLRELTTEQLAQVFSGQIVNWEELGGSGGPIHLYARDEQSGTFDTFKELVLLKYGKTLSRSASRLESSEQLSYLVSQDLYGIGFIGLPYILKAKAVAIADGEAKPMLPTVSLIATEDYPLSRRLYFYLPPEAPQHWAQALVQFAQSPEGQAIVAQSGFVAQTVQAIQVQPTAQMPRDYQVLTREAQRLSVNFRFAQGSARLDSKAQQDLTRVIDYLKHHNKMNGSVTLVGFGDAKSDPARATLLSKLRAMAVRRELIKNNVIVRDIRGFGEDMPVAGNDVDGGRIKNRRVEVWVN
ncbi:substrate-binding domain-containing protein [Pseudomonas sp. DWP3-1-2]|uniref:substrate-binding domain-containing protein n=1 Tax=Pseudomonas sp. DWP3-1-2 TaxID=2804645 RepID=UPI003CE67284